MKRLLILAAMLLSAGMSAAQVDYNTRIQPIFNSNCTACHGGTSGVTLNNYSAVMNSVGFQYGRNIVVPEDPDDSPLYDKISSNNPQFGVRMPEGGPPLNDNDIEAIRQWIEEGALEEAATDAETDPVAYQFRLTGNYPNPFNPTTTITFTLPQRSDFIVRVTNILGREVHLYRGTSSAGEVSVTVDLSSSNSSGVYLYEVTLENGGEGLADRLVGSMTLLK